MALRTIVEIGDNTLRKVCREQTKFDSRLAKLLDDMADTMYEANGVGLAAPQIGILRRIAVVDVSEGEEEDELGLVEFINPQIIAREGSQEGVEGCLSVPGRQGMVTRPEKITVQAQDRFGNPFQLEAEGFFARAICHELDHLDGILYVDKMDRELTKEEIKRNSERG